MKQFFQSTYYFWLITKLIFAIAGFISVIELLSKNRIKPSEALLNYVAALYCILLVLDVIFSFIGNSYKFLKYIIGFISIALGLIIFVVMLNVRVISVPVTLLFILWVILLGLFDLLQIKRKLD
jgi:hypothetical protein